jgi:hypothetical protein
MDMRAPLDVIAPSADSPWKSGQFVPDLERLEALLSLIAGAPDRWDQATGPGLGLALDNWAAGELRRAGYEDDAVWPRTAPPRVLPAAVARSLGRLSRSARASPVAIAIERGGGASSPVVHGEFFPKNVDVLVADWDRGVEIMISTKSMSGSFNNNLNNRWEEFVGDVRNIRGRFPLAALGVLFLADHSILDSSAFPRLLDMLHKLRGTSVNAQAYDATALVIARATGAGTAELVMDQVPSDLAPGQFFRSILDTVFTRLPVSERQAARALYGAAILPTAEVSDQGVPEAEGHSVDNASSA